MPFSLRRELVSPGSVAQLHQEAVRPDAAVTEFGSNGSGPSPRLFHGLPRACRSSSSPAYSSTGLRVFRAAISGHSPRLEGLERPPHVAHCGSPPQPVALPGLSPSEGADPGETQPHAALLLLVCGPPGLCGGAGAASATELWAAVRRPGCCLRPRPVPVGRWLRGSRRVQANFFLLLAWRASRARDLWGFFRLTQTSWTL